MPIGFLFCLDLPLADPPFAQASFGVLPAHRRRGVGRQMLAQAIDQYRGRRATLFTAADASVDTAAPFARACGFTPVRTFWTMARPLAPTPPLVWPDGFATRLFDHSESMLEDFRHVAHTSFAENWGFVPWTMEIARREIAQPSFRADGLLFAYRGATPVGFIYNVLHRGRDATGARGEVDTLGVLADARGLGLGRALLRWGVEWLQSQAAADVTLLVDGANAAATRLYRSEGFVVRAERQAWELPLSPLP